MAVGLRPFVRAKVDFFSPEKKDQYIRSLPELIDFNSIHNKDHLFCIQAQPDDTFVKVTCRQFKAAITRCAQWLTETISLPPPSDARDGETKPAPVALLMESDLGLLIHQFALISLGIPPLVLSARLSPEAIFHLVKTTQAAGIVVSQRISEHPAFGNAKAMMQFYVGRPYHSLYSNDDFAPVDNYTVYPEDVDKEILLLHSSGTTGLPKPIALTHRQLVFAVSHGDFDTEEEAQGVNISTLPLFHGFGLLAPGLSMSIGKTVCFPSPDRFANAQHIVGLIASSNAAGMMTVPFLLEDIVSLPNGKGITALAGLDFVATGGSALSASTGKALTESGVKLLNLYGTTETGPLTKTFSPKDNYNWKYFRLRTDMHFEISELAPYNGERRFRLTVYPFGSAKPFEIADQLIRNEEFPETDFAAVGRDDDVIVLATGEKVNPLLLETGLIQSGLVKTAIVFGADRFEVGIIVEPFEPIYEESGREGLKTQIWPLLVQINERMDATARIYSPSSIIVLRPDIVIPRTDKGSIARKEVYKLLEKEINEVYENADQSAIPAAPLDYDNLEEGLKILIQTRLNLQANDDSWTAETNLFDLGLDSLQGAILRRLLLSAAAKTPSEVIGRDFIYTNPSIRSIANVLRDPNAAATSNEVPIQEIERFVQQYSTKEIIKNPRKSTSGAVVLLTGSSGSLGCHMLAELAKSSDVAKVICLSRKGHGNSIMTSQDLKSLVQSRGIVLSDDNWEKIAIQECDPTKDNLGLPEQVYTSLAESVTHVLHAAWPMNFNMRLSSFTYQFSYLKNLLRLTLSKNTAPSRQRTRFVFISSIAVLAKVGLEKPGQIIPEASLHLNESACGIGYADGKLVCEKILEEAAQVHATQLEISIIRCGQLAGSKKSGAWNINEQIPMLLKTSQSMGIMPELYGTASWIPVDEAAAVVSEVLLTYDNGTTYVHVENPVRQAWNDILQILGKELGVRDSVPFDQWLSKLASISDNDSEAYPAKKLYQFFSLQFRVASCGTVIMGTDNARRVSGSLRKLTALDDAILRRFVNYWRQRGYLH